MPAIARKICVLGDFGVGKTSVTRRFVEGAFSDDYITTVGVNVKQRDLTLADGTAVKLMVWDVAGAKDESEIPKMKAYLRGTHGYLLVADGTRAYTLEHAQSLRESLGDALPDVPHVVLINKSDLEDEQEIGDDAIKALREAGTPCHRTSAKTGDNVEQAFAELAAALAG